MILHHYQPDDAAAVSALRYLEESSRTHDLGKGRAVMFHRGQSPHTQDHLHFLERGRELYGLNRDGTAHDASHGAQMHR